MKNFQRVKWLKGYMVKWWEWETLNRTCNAEHPMNANGARPFQSLSDLG